MNTMMLASTAGKDQNVANHDHDNMTHLRCESDDPRARLSGGTRLYIGWVGKELKLQSCAEAPTATA
ncbi:MAG: hypothetical protein KA375_12310 [Vitreoscilla sp.]|nr:hypothetical protein [Burkholderiales bacterium]MBP6338375.1 hypothetical protein [Vitreoscilla sp.]MBP6677208.1 hypothetical protein [Vitreoscilla sp.]